jgi:transcriptional regulator with XRE-family HTH domain
MDSTFASRVKEFRLFKKLSQAAFAEQCGLEQGNVTQMERGTEPKQSNVAKVVAGFPDLNPDWLLLGSGSMLRDGRTLTKAQPFLPGGEVNQFGATVMPKGGQRAALGDNFGEDMGKPMHTAEPVLTQQDFIKGLLKEIDVLKEERKNLMAVISEQRESLKEQRENTQFLREQVQQLQLQGKHEGNQYEAPVSYAAEPPAPPIGFGRVRAMWPAELVHGESEREAA